jgi:hypothetical protein
MARVCSTKAKADRAAEADEAARADEAACVAAAAASKQAARAPAKAKYAAMMARRKDVEGRLKLAFDRIRLRSSLNAWREAVQVHTMSRAQPMTNPFTANNGNTTIDTSACISM